MSSRTERFQRKPNDPEDKPLENDAESQEVLRFSPEEEAVSIHVKVLTLTDKSIGITQ